MRFQTMQRYAKEAGFERVDILPIDHFFFRFYRLYASDSPEKRSI
jgi:hypothetical protein